MPLAFFDNSKTPSQAQIAGDQYAMECWLQHNTKTTLPPSAAFGYWGALVSPTAPSQVRDSLGTRVGFNHTGKFSAATGASYES